MYRRVVFDCLLQVVKESLRPSRMELREAGGGGRRMDEAAPKTPGPLFAHFECEVAFCCCKAERKTRVLVEPNRASTKALL